MRTSGGCLRRKTVHLFWSAILLAGWVCLAPATAAAAPPPPPLVAFILPRDNARFQTIHDAFMRGFEKVTTVAGKPRIYVQSPNPDVMSVRNSMRKATALGADLYVIYGTLAAMAAIQEDFTEPLIFADVFEPVAMGLVPSMQRGTDLVTGVAGNAPVQTLLKVLQETVGESRLGILIDPRNPASKTQIDVLRKAACRRGAAADAGGRTGEPCWLDILPFSVQKSFEIRNAVKEAGIRANSIFLSDLMPTDDHAAKTLDYAIKARLPVIGHIPGTAEGGAFIVLETSADEQGRLLADIARRIMDGDLPEDIPPAMPRQVSLIINLKVAGELGIQVPFPVLTQATKVIR